LVILFVLFTWLVVGFLALGIAGFHFVTMNRKAMKPWNFNINGEYLPKISIIVPTLNEAQVIRLKLLNLLRLDYPNSLLHVIVVDSNSTDGTLDIVKGFASRHPSLDLECLSLIERGKTAALNFALKQAVGDVVLVSDADCFYEQDVLKKAIPYLSVSDVGAISGVKLILNKGSSSIAKAEADYLASMNGIKLGESKLGFTPLFEGGFSAYKIDAIKSFDPYKTGSDDCGSIIKLAEEGRKAILVSEAAFLTGFPTSWRERINMKVRRSNQLIRIFARYLSLLFQGRIKVGRRVIASDAYIYLLCPSLFVAFLCLTPVTFWFYPWLLLLLLVFAVPRVGSMLFELCQSYLLLFVGLVSVASGRTALVWTKPKDRESLSERLLADAGLI
jgi:cellulose synthase/poly-beta-1,6-N-acetylglucosamine synthase-like glycosyltransferase